jgi:hypothetical protein
MKPRHDTVTQPYATYFTKITHLLSGNKIRCQ